MQEKREGFMIRLYPSEKQKLIERAKESGYESIADYVRHMCFQEKDMTLESLIGRDPKKALDTKGKARDKTVAVMLNEDEYEIVKKCAGNMTLSAYCRKLLMTQQLGAIKFDISDGDLSALANELSFFNVRMEGIIAALSYRSELYKEDIDHMKELLEEVNKEVKSIYKTTMTDRKYIRKKGIENLRKRMEKIFEKNKEGLV